MDPRPPLTLETLFMANTEKPVKQFAFLKLQRDSVERKKGIVYYKTFESESERNTFN